MRTVDTAENPRPNTEQEADYLALAQEVGKIGTYSYDFRTGERRWSAEMFRIRGFSPANGAPGTEVLRATILPEDLHLTMHQGPRPTRNASATKDYAREYRVRHAVSGELRWLASSVRIYFGPDGAPERYIGVQTDITDRKNQEQSLKALGARVRIAESAARFGMFEMDLRSGLRTWSPELYRLRGYDPAKPLPSIAEYQASILPEDSPQFLQNQLRDFRPNGQMEADFIGEYRFRQGDSGALRWSKTTTRVYFDGNGQPLRWIGLQQDITEARETEEALRASERRLMVAQEATGFGIYDRNLESGEGHWSPEMFQMRGMPILGKPPGLAEVHEMLLPEDRHASLMQAQRQAPTAEEIISGRRIATEFRVRRQDNGDARTLLTAAHMKFKPDGTPQQIIGAQIDVTALRQTQQALRRSEERYRLAISAFQGAVFEQDLVAGTIHRSEGYGEVLGLRPDGMSIHERVLHNRIHPEDRAIRRDALAREEQTKEGVATYVARYRHTAGHWVYLRCHSVVVRDEQGVAIRRVGTLIDCTTEQLALEALRHSEERFRLAAAANQACIFDRDLRTGQTRRTGNYIGVTGFNPHDLPDYDASPYLARMEHVHPDDQQPLAAALDKTLADGLDSFQHQYRTRHAKGHWVHVACSALILRDSEGVPYRIVGSLVDVTRQRAAEDELRQSEERLRLAQQAARLGIYEWDFTSRSRTWSPQMFELHGLPATSPQPPWLDPEEASAADGLPRSILNLISQRGCAAPTTFQVEYAATRVADGSRRNLLSLGSIHRDDAGNPTRIRGVEMDITDLRSAQREILRNADLRRLNLEAVRAGFWELDTTNARLDWTPETFELFGRDLALGPPAIDGWAELIHPEDRDRVVARVQACHDNPRLELREEFRVRRPDGTEAWLFSIGNMVTDDPGQPCCMRGIIVDITDRKRAEERQGLLAREVDHRAKNALATVSAVVRLTRADTIEEFRAAVERRVAALARAHTLLAGHAWSGASIQELVAGEVEAYATSGRCQIAGPRVQVRPSQVQAVSLILHELTTNAAKYGALSHPAGQLSVDWALLPEGGAVIHWTETGSEGVHPATRKGFGSRLIAATVGHQVDGTFTTEWRPDGVRHRLILGRQTIIQEQEPSQPRQGHEAGQGPGAMPLPAGLRVLVVEDEALIAATLSDMLEMLGCTPVGPASNVATALGYLAAGEAVDVAILDINLGHEDSLPVANFLRQHGIPFVFATGYSQLPPEAAAFGDTLTVQKPLTEETLAQALARIAAKDAGGP